MKIKYINKYLIKKNYADTIILTIMLIFKIIYFLEG